MAKRFRVAIIGSTGRGDYGHELDEAWSDLPDVELVGVADDNEAGLAKTAAKLGLRQTFTDYRKMFDAVKPDIVTIGPRRLDQHRDMALAAAERGVHIYMEKPFCRTLAEADQVIDTCERTHAKLAIAHPTRYSPKLQRVKELLDAGRFGKVLEYRGRGKEDQRGGSEDLWVLGSHVMDMIRALGGHPQWCFASVEQQGKPVSKSDVAEGAEGIGPLAGDTVRAMYGMPDGSTAYFSSIRGVAGNPSRYGLRVYCSHGIIEILEGILPSVTCLRDRGWAPARSGKAWEEITSQGIGKPETLTGPRYASRHQLALEDLLSAIREQRQPMGNMYEARGATEMIVGVFESHRQRKAVTFPLESRENPLTLLA
jgi:predicted dehydrogenase